MTKEAAKVKVLQWDTDEIKEYITDQLAKINAQQSNSISIDQNELDARFKKLQDAIDYVD